jgi:hypothetical protein
MALPEHVRLTALRKVNDYCERRAPAHVRDEVQVEARVRGDKITIIERHAPWHPDLGSDWTDGKIAPLSYHQCSRTWELFAYERRIAYPFITSRLASELPRTLDFQAVASHFGQTTSRAGSQR